MLPAAQRLRRSADFQAAARRGLRVSRGLFVLHVRPPSSSSDGAGVTRVGFSVSKSVGGSVVRHRVARRMRDAMRTRVSLLPAGTTIVVRALPAAASATRRRLDEELDSALATAASRLAR